MAAPEKLALQGWADYQVMIVDDGSKDRTAEIAIEASRHMPLTLIQHTRNQGLGAAIRTGLKAASHTGWCGVGLVRGEEPTGGGHP